MAKQNTQPNRQLMAQAIKAQLGGKATDEQVEEFLTALETVQEGDPVGTVRREMATGRIAHRVMEGGNNKWYVTGPDGEFYIDTQSTLSPEWAVVYAVATE